MPAQEQQQTAPAAEEKPGTGVDRTLIQRLLALSPAQRVQMLMREARNLAALDAKFRSEHHAVGGRTRQ